NAFFFFLHHERIHPRQSPLYATSRRVENNGDLSAEVSSIRSEPSTSTRRKALSKAASSLVAATFPLIPTSQRGLAADGGDYEGVVSQSELASLLKRIPTFAIVDPRGAPYFVVGEDAKLTSYFFLSYGEARRILDVAVSSSDKAIRETKRELEAKNGKLTNEDEEAIGSNPWKDARVTSVPLDLAVSLASRGKLAGAYFRLAPSESDIEDALEADGTDDLPEGKVPLFYAEDMTMAEDSEAMSPLYFRKDQLIDEWRRQRRTKGASGGANEKSIPDVKVTELFATITEMVRPGGSDEELKTLRFVAPAGSEADAKRCRKGEKEPFRLGERLIVL
ncbi:hypothetical protein ACHAWF_000770, partial [Thalassiosira exigua]